MKTTSQFYLALLSKLKKIDDWTFFAFSEFSTLQKCQNFYANEMTLQYSFKRSVNSWGEKETQFYTKMLGVSKTFSDCKKEFHLFLGRNQINLEVMYLVANFLAKKAWLHCKQLLCFAGLSSSQTQWLNNTKKGYQ